MKLLNNNVQIYDLIKGAHSKLDQAEYIEILSTLLTFTSKGVSLYLVIAYYDTVFVTHSLLLFTYLLYALLELIALTASFILVISFNVMCIIFRFRKFNLDSIVFIDIINKFLKFCFTVTFFVQSIASMIFTNFQNWIFPLVLVSSLFIIIMLQVSRIVLLIGGRVSCVSKYADINLLLQIFTSKKTQSNLNKTRHIIYNLVKFYQSIRPEDREYLENQYKNSIIKEEIEKTAISLQEKLLKKKEELAIQFNE